MIVVSSVMMCGCGKIRITGDFQRHKIQFVFLNFLLRNYKCEHSFFMGLVFRVMANHLSVAVSRGCGIGGSAFGTRY